MAKNIVDFSPRRVMRDYSTSEKIKAYYRNVFDQERTYALRTFKEPEFISDIDYTRGKRREETALRYYEIFKEEMESVCPDAEGTYYNVEEWAILNARCSFGYDYMDWRADLSAAITIYLMDEIFEADRLEDLDELFESLDYEKLFADRYLQLEYPLYEYRTLLATRSILFHRNDDCKGYRKKEPAKLVQAGFKRVFADDLTAKGKQKQDVGSRRRFEALLALIPEERREATKEYYRQKWHELFLLYFKCRAVLVEEQKKFMKKSDHYMARLEREVNTAQSVAHSLERGASPYSKEYLNEMLIGKNSERDEAIVQLCMLANEETDLQDRIDLLRTGFDEFPYIHDQLLPDDFSKEILKLLSSFVIEDPYKLLTGAFLLMDEGDDLLWLYGISTKLLSMCGRQLPWGRTKFNEDEDPAWPLEPIRAEEGADKRLAVVYQNESVEQDDMRKSFAQIIYEYTGAVLPRYRGRYDFADEELKKYGLSEAEIQMAKEVMNAYGSIFNQYKHMDDEFFTEYEEADEETLDSDSTEVKQLKEEIKHLRAQSHAFQKEARKQQEELLRLKSEIKCERNELAGLREVVFHQENVTEMREDTTVSYPYTVRKNTVVLGGHMTFLSGITPMFTGEIRFVDTNKSFDTNLVANADVVWLQTNAMSHTAYHKIMNVVRAKDIPLRYFANAGVKTCALQIVEEDRKSER